MPTLLSPSQGQFTFDAHLIRIAILRRVMRIRICIDPVHIVLLKFMAQVFCNGI